MSIRDVQITGLGPDYKDTRVTIDGTDIPPRWLSGLSLQADANDIPRLALRLPVRTVADLNGKMNVVIPDKTRELLVELGWTPPADE